MLWSFRTTSREATGETPFNLVYGSKAILTVEIGLSSYRVEFFDHEANDRARREELDVLEGGRLEAYKSNGL